MAITVRFPNGTTVTYNDADNTRITTGGAIEILRTKDGTSYWVAAIPAGCQAIVEHKTPCTIRRSGQSLVGDAIKALLGARSTTRYGPDTQKLRELKAMLRNFDARTGCWK